MYTNSIIILGEKKYEDCSNSRDFKETKKHFININVYYIPK